MPNPLQGPCAALVAAVATVCAGCTPFHFDHQDVELRPDPEADRFELVVTYHDVRAKPDSDRQPTDAFLQRILAKERVLVLYDLPLELDQELDETRIREEFGELADDLMAMLGGVSVLDVGSRLDEEGAPVVWQRLEFRHAELALSLFNHALNRAILSEQESDEGAGDPRLAATQRLWVEKAEARGTWLALGARGLVLTLPVEPEGLGAIVARMANTQSEESRAGDAFGMTLVMDLLASITEIHQVDGELRLIFGCDEGAIQWRLHRPDLGADTPIDLTIIGSDWFQAALVR